MEYTNEDVAGALGWYKKQLSDKSVYGDVWVDRNNSVVCLGHMYEFLSPGVAAETNAIKYVLPWLRDKWAEQPRDFYFWGSFINHTAKNTEVMPHAWFTNLILDDDFGPTLCKAILDAIHK